MNTPTAGFTIISLSSPINMISNSKNLSLPNKLHLLQNKINNFWVRKIKKIELYRVSKHHGP